MTLEEKVRGWILSRPDGTIYESVNQHIDYLATELYCEYEPTKGPYPDFWQRFEAWIENAHNEADQQTLFRLMSSLFFIGPQELDNLYRVAFNRNITKWLVDQLSLALDDPALPEKVSAGLAQTWFCPLTDSMRINAFYHLNHISGRNHRPDWLSLAVLGDPQKVDNFLQAKGIKRIVLLEDFIGNGSQVNPAISFAGSLTSKLPTLVVPLVICPSGAARATAWQTTFANITCSPVLELREFDFLSKDPRPDEPDEHGKMRKLASDCFSTLLGGQNIHEAKVYGPFGFGDTGGLVVLSTNCPDNTLPLIHHRSPTWSPLFPRASRI
jgi:hypothetical protein